MHDSKMLLLPPSKAVASRPKRKATNQHKLRFLQTRNPTKLEENDLKKALEASLEDCPDYWIEDSASCSSSEHSNGTASSSTSTNKSKACGRQSQTTNAITSNLSPVSAVHNRYKPVAKKTIYHEADFFHDGIMEYIEYELSISCNTPKKRNNSLDSDQ